MNIAKMMKQAQQMQAKMAEMQTQMEATELDGQAGGGMVTVRLNGKGEMKGVTIDPATIADGDTEMLEDLILAAHNDAKAKLADMMAEQMQAMTGDLNLPPGFKLPF